MCSACSRQGGCCPGDSLCPGLVAVGAASPTLCVSRDDCKPLLHSWRPDASLLSWLPGLSDYTPQSNNFVVFNQYFAGQGMQQGRPEDGAWVSICCGLN